MKYLAHIREDGEEQTLLEHLKNTAECAGNFAAEFGAYDLGYCAGMLHDIGKYSAAFQRRLRGSGETVDHATAGAQLCYKMKGLYGLLSYCIAGHHAGLPDTGGESDDGGRSTWYGRMKKTVENYQAYEEEVAVPELKEPACKPVKGEKYGFFKSMLIRMVYSCLVDADYLDTERFMQNGMVERDSGNSVEVLYQRLMDYIEGWLKNENLETINGRRTEILKSCLKGGEGEQGLYRLTVPTGGGKTWASMAFALQHAKRHGKKRIIYVIPYTSIIEQNAAVFAAAFGKENVLENHCNVDYKGGEELRSLHLAAENWDKPIAVTTNVNFFESLFSNRSSQCRKLHNIVNSVLIFDEAQLLPNDYLKPCVAVMEELIRYYGCTAVLCTATQPALQSFFSNDMKAVELCPRMEEQFQFFKRNKVEQLGELSEEQLLKKLEMEKQALCIVNTRKRAQRLYSCLAGEGVYHLSTTMYPKHRRKILDKIRLALREGKRCIVIATSLVEAGVDLDFQTVYRQLAGVDSIIQAGGRCNREGKRPWRQCYIYVFQLEGAESVPGQRQQTAVTRMLLQANSQLDSLKTIQAYFENVYHFQGESLDKKKILERLEKQMPFKTIAEEFKLIETKMWTILILKEDGAKELYDEIRRLGLTKTRMIIRRLPRGRRGLKSCLCVVRACAFSSPPSREAWIEMLIVM